MVQEKYHETDSAKKTNAINQVSTKHRSEGALRIIKLLNVVVNGLLFSLCWHLFYGAGISLNKSLLLVGGYAIFLTWLSRTYNAYHIDSLRISEVLYSLLLACIITDIITYLGIVSICWQWKNPVYLLGLLGVQAVWNAVWSVGANRLYFRLYQPKRTMVIYRREDDLEKIQQIPNLSARYEIDGYIKNPVEIYSLLKGIEGHEAVFIVGIPATLRNGVAKYCIEKNIELYAVPHVGDIIMAGAQHMQMYSIPVMRVLRAKAIPEYLFFKRIADIAISLLALIVLSPIMLLTAVAIKLQDGGPVFYRQKRLTKDGKVFEILKFRSMIVSAEKDGKARLASEHDDRITPVGKIIRACRVDELPQLINIVKGDMSIVGPRPERPEIAAQYEEEIPAFALRLQVKAGLTGLAQIYGRYNTTPHDKLQMDLMYINRMSVMEDLRLMFATVKVLFQKESTSGIGDGAVTALEQKNNRGGVHRSISFRGSLIRATVRLAPAAAAEGWR